MPIKRGKRKPKKVSRWDSEVPSTIPQTLLDGVPKTDEAGLWNWVDQRDYVCKEMGLPDVGARQGLKQVHENFEIVMAKIDQLYRIAKRKHHDVLAGAAVALCHSLCADSILKDRILRQRDYLERLFDLVNSPEPSCRQMVLDALNDAACTGGSGVCLVIIKSFPILLRIAEEYVDDKVTVGPLWTLISSVVKEIFKTKNDKFIALLDVPSLIRVAISTLRLQQSSLRPFHILDFLEDCASLPSDDVSANPSAINLALSCARSKDIHVRASGLEILFSLNEAKVKFTEEIEPEVRIAMHVREDEIKRGYWPKRIQKKLNRYGITRTESFIRSRIFQYYAYSMDRVSDTDGDMLAFGHELGTYIMYVEDAIPTVYYAPPEVPIEDRQPCGPGLGLPPPARWWAHSDDAVHYASVALRELGQENDLCVAALLELQHHMMAEDTEAAYSLAQDCIEKYPDVGFFYYALTYRQCCPDVGLRFAKKGLECAHLTDGLRFAMLYSAADFGMRLALTRLAGARSDQKMLDEGYALAVSAWEDSKEFIECAPPDAKRMMKVCYGHTLMSLLLYGHEQDPGLMQLKETREAFRLAEDVARHVDRPISKKPEWLVSRTIYDRMASAAKEWDATVQRWFEGGESGRPTEEWRIYLDAFLASEPHAGHEDHAHMYLRNKRRSRFTVRRNILHAPLRTCSWCNNATAMLFTCKGCGKVSYCGEECQTWHWKTSHREACRRRDRQKLLELA